MKEDLEPRSFVPSIDIGRWVVYTGSRLELQTSWKNYLD